MKKTLLITSVLLAFFCFSCDDEPLDSNIAIDTPTSGGSTGGGNGGGTGGGGTGGGNGGGGSTATLSAYTYDVTANAPIFGEIITNTDFNIQQGIVVSQNIEVTVFGFTENSLSTYTRDTTGKITLIQDNAGGSGQNTTTITYDGNNISQIDYDFSADDTDDYTYNFTYSGNTISKTTVGSTDTATFTFDPSSSRLVSIEYFDNGTSIQTETLSYSSEGNCTQSVVTVSGTPRTSTFNYDTFTNPLQTVFQDVYMLSILNGDHEDEISGTIANFHGANNWIGGTSTDGTFDFSAMYDTDNKILSKSGSYDLGDGVTIDQSEAFQY